MKRPLRHYRFSPEGDIRADIKSKYHFDGDLVDHFLSIEDALVDKWHHYIPIYDTYFSRFRDQDFKFLEIGVSKGGSMQMWRKYFGKKATIFGIDIDPNCAKFDGEAGQVRIGSQDDPEFLLSVVEEMGGVDVILDDGSHVMKHIRTSLGCLFPQLSETGVYMIEDLHTAYWEKWGGGYNHPENIFRFAHELIHDMHHWYHKDGQNFSEISSWVSGLHAHDSILVLEKNRPYKPVSSRVGVST